MKDFSARNSRARAKARLLRWEEQKGRCLFCNRQCKFERTAKTIEERNSWFVLDHIVPTKHGGSDMYSNQQGTCWLCNEKKGSQKVFTPELIHP